MKSKNFLKMEIVGDQYRVDGENFRLSMDPNLMLRGHSTVGIDREHD